MNFITKFFNKIKDKIKFYRDIGEATYKNGYIRGIERHEEIKRNERR